LERRTDPTRLRRGDQLERRPEVAGSPLGLGPDLGQTDKEKDALIDTADVLVEKLQALDGWLSKDGFFPAAWHSINAGRRYDFGPQQ
jgi:hypothetical protein